MTRRKAAIDQLAKDLGPSHVLRKWFGHDPRRWAEFRRRYRLELRRQRKALEALVRRAAHRPVTPVYGARDTAHNNAGVLKRILEQMQTRIWWKAHEPEIREVTARKKEGGRHG